MAEVKVTMGFRVRCRECGKAVEVGPTAHKRGSDLTFYFEPGTEEPNAAAVVGVSDGDGASFRHLDCKEESGA